MTPTGWMTRVREVFDQAVDVPTEERGGFVERACGGDERLRREVMELLAMDASASATPTAPGLGGMWLARQIHEDAEQDADTAPESIGGYRIVRELGRGGMGIVYEAMEEEPARRVALKVIHPGLLGPGALRRFRRESRAMAGLKHRGIVQLYAAGSAMLTPGGPPRPFLAMELVEGVSLREHVRRERPSVEQRLWLLAQIADAVHHAHQKGVIHRDLKPDNILIQPAAGSGETSGATDAGVGVEPKILDFGVSRLLEGDDTASLRTLDGQIVGTFPYLSPEQAGGDADATDTRSDVYALGVIAFEVLSGQAPFDVAGLPARSAVRVVLNDAPKRLRAIEPGVHPDVQTIVHKAMHRDPAARYASAAEFAADLRRFLAFQPILARPPSWGYVASRFVRRHRALSAISAVSAAAIVVSVVAIVLLWNDARRTREAAVWQAYRSALSAASSAIAAGDIATARRELEASPPQHRGWEFRHLFARLDQSRRVTRPEMKPPFSVHVESGERVVLVRAGEMLRVGLEGDGAEGVVDGARFFEHAGRCGRPPHFFVDADDPAWRGLLAPLASVLAQPEPGQETRRIRCLDLSVSGDGGVLAVLLDTGGQHEVVVRRAGETEARRVAPEPNGRWARIRLSRDGTRLFAASAESDPKPSRVEMIDVETLARLSASQTLGRVVFSMAPLGEDRIAFVLQSGDLESWDLSPGAVRRVARAEYVHDAAENLTLSPDGKVLASASRDGLVRVFDAASLALVYELSGHESEIADVGFTPDSRRIVSSGRDGTLRVWDAARATPNPLPLTGHTHLVHPLAYAASRGQVVTGSWDRTVAVYDAGTGERLAERTLDTIVLDVVLSPDERMVLTRELGGRVHLMDARTLSEGAAIPEHVRVLDQPAFDRASGLVLLNYDAARAQALVWDIAAGAERTLPGTALEAFVGPFLNARAGLIAVTQNRGGVRTTVLYRYADGVEMMAKETTRPAIESVAFSPDMRTMALVETDQRIVLYDTETLRAIGACVGHTREVLGVVFSPNGSRLFSADLTGAIRVWDTGTWEQVALLLGHESHIRRMIMSPDGRLLISGSRDGTARVWMAP